MADPQDGYMTPEIQMAMAQAMRANPQPPMQVHPNSTGYGAPMDEETAHAMPENSMQLPDANVSLPNTGARAYPAGPDARATGGDVMSSGGFPQMAQPYHEQDAVALTPAARAGMQRLPVNGGIARQPDQFSPNGEVQVLPQLTVHPRKPQSNFQQTLHKMLTGGLFGYRE